ncbi:hypothetical protein DF021_22800 [Burkholderia stagnalis]|uniref:Uncharacterized protein n=1 Tax=Burkholderia stagnalis TaxID=1503054 RepID=A0ABX9YIC1_9BURK|nr:hypothetical protein DF158_24950 [Burkholderia stagnalis]RQQ64751.1 hypothetical protein DF137_23935 [Burkholderia stagnalis]RQQ65471.1 hypothetical protein DF139_23705 [Burkholderia stagnalis]RQQ77769.1 hypothetical protein DF138_23230 [Burkholderia stagnalis]RQQ85302.1 hypothetical protein DF134_25240 [Burkholderia stagnalis]
MWSRAGSARCRRAFRRSAERRRAPAGAAGATQYKAISIRTSIRLCGCDITPFPARAPQIFLHALARSGNACRLHTVTKNCLLRAVLFAYIAIHFDAFVVSKRLGGTRARRP